MAVGQFTVCDPAWLDLLQQTLDLVGSPVAAILVDTSHTPNKELESTYSQIGVAECSDPDYAPVAVTGRSWANPSARTFRFDAALVDFAPLDDKDISARYIYLIQGTAASLGAADRIIGYMDLNDTGGNLTSINGDFSVDWSAADGVFTMTIQPA